MDNPPLTRPRIYLIRMAVFLVLAGFVAFILYRQIWNAFLANPGLNALILGVMLIGVILAVRQVWRLFPEVRWVNTLNRTEEGFVSPIQPVLLAPMATLIANRSSRAALSVTTMRSLLDSVGARLDESREIVRYLAGLLVFLGLLGTFWGLIETVGSVGRIIASLRTGQDAAVLFDELKNALSGPLQGMGLSFSASLFGLAGSLIVGFLDLQAGQAQSRFYTDLEDWLSTTVRDLGVSEGVPHGVRSGDFMPGRMVEELAAAIDRFEQAITARPGAAPGEPISISAVTAIVHRLEQALKPMARMPEIPVEKFTAAIERLERVVEDTGTQRATGAMVKLAESLQALVQHMRSEQQLLRDWVEAQADQQNEIRGLLQRLARKEGERI